MVKDKDEFGLRRLMNDDMRLDELQRRLNNIKTKEGFRKDTNNPYISINIKFGSEIKVVRISDIRVGKNNNGINEIYIESRRDGEEKKGRSYEGY